MKVDDYRKHCDETLARLHAAARKADELSFLFALLGINSGEESPGWQPMEETRALVFDFVGLINAPVQPHTQARLALVLYCHITEANFIYHDIYNFLLSAKGEPPRVFNFLDKYQNGRPPSVSAKLTEINSVAAATGFSGITQMFDEIIRPDIRNAVYHSDYTLHDDVLRLKHRGDQIKEVPLTEVQELLQKTLSFFDCILAAKVKGLKSFPKGYRITGRKHPKGYDLSSIDVLVDDDGMARGFSSSDPLPLW